MCTHLGCTLQAYVPAVSLLGLERFSAESNLIFGLHTLCANEFLQCFHECGRTKPTRASLAHSARELKLAVVVVYLSLSLSLSGLSLSVSLVLHLLSILRSRPIAPSIFSLSLSYVEFVFQQCWRIYYKTLIDQDASDDASASRV